MLLKLLQTIPTQWQVMFPTHEDKRNWLWLSRLAFHSRRASASLPILVAILGGEAAEEEETANWEEEANTRMIMIVVSKTRIRTLMQLGSGFSTKDIMTSISWGDVKCC